jgi:UDP-N-acetylglucosamine--N-acetylmuramyl-(pentapeptide) pyrophosphoryl-undecaprenol N-acetylglucosamine transferase
MTGPRPLSVLLAGGGSAGHVNPLLATADALRRRAPEARLTVLGTREGLEADLVPARGYPLRTIEKVPFPRRPGKAALAFPGQLRAVTLEVRRIIADVEADVVVGFGGYVSAPAYLAARRAGVPVVIHEQNARPGFANRLGARFTRHVAVTFPSTKLPHARVVGLPLREEIADLDRQARRAEGLEHFGLVDGPPTLLVFGGSLGALRLNQAFAGAAADLAAAGVQVLHLTGAGKELDIEPDPAAPYRALAYTDRMDLAYAVADLAVCRAGAGTVCELSAVGLPAVYVPLPIGNGEQRLNAAAVVAAGGGLLVDDAQVTPDWVRSEVIPLVTDRERLELMGREAAVMGHREADDTLAEMVIRAASGEPPPAPEDVVGPPDPVDPVGT